MNKKSMLKILLAVMAIAVLAVGATAVFAQDGDEPPSPERVPGFGSRNHDHFGRSQFDGPGRLGDHEALLAEELGISVETLQEAHAAVRETVLAEAVEAGLLSQAQADALAVLGDMAPFGPMGKGPHGGFGNQLGIDGQALLADELGISVETLQEAQEAAKAAGLAQAIEDGVITAEQAELMEAQQALKSYIEKDVILADVLGISEEELQAAKEDGTRIPDLIDELGLDMATVQENLAAAHEAAIEAAVEDGVITQEQADQLGTFRQPGPRGHRGGFGGRGPQRFPGFDRLQPGNGGATSPALDA